MKNKVLIILGMHRSGTSMISQWLYKSGLWLGDELLGPAASNSEGHYEDVDFLNFHEAALKARQLPATGLTGEPFAPLSVEEKEELRNIISKKNVQRSEWGWKEPRTCLLLQEYVELIPEAYHLIIIRNFADAVSSLVNRDFIIRDTKKRSPLDEWIWQMVRRPFIRNRFYKEIAEMYLKVWVAYNEAILQHIKTLPGSSYIVVDYNTLIKNDQSIFTRLTNNWHFHLNPVSFKQVFNSKLLGKPKKLDRFVTDKSLLKKAIAIETALRSFS